MYRALVSFSGVISMALNEEREITDKNLIKDLLKAGYIEKVKTADKKKADAELPKADETSTDENSNDENSNDEVNE